MLSVKNQDKRNMMGIMEMFNENKTEKNSDLLLQSSKIGNEQQGLGF